MIRGEQYIPVREMLRRVWETGRGERIEYQVQLPGETRWFVSRMIPLARLTRGPGRLCFIGWDITDCKLADENLLKSQALLAESEQLANTGSWELNVKSGSIFWSDNLYRLHGYAPGEVVPTADACLQMLPPDDQQRAKYLLAQAIASRQPMEHEYRCTVKDGRLRTMRTRFVPCFSESGEPLRIVGSTQDITDRNLAEETIRKSEALLGQAEEIAGFGYWDYDVATGRTILSRNLLELLGFPSNEEWDVERYWNNVLRSDRESVRRMVLDAIAQCKPFEYVTRYRIPGGSGRVYHVGGEPVAGCEGSAARVRGVVRDITSQMRAEEELRSLSQELMRAQDTERRQIARNLHESAGQTLAALKMTLANLEDSLPENSDETRGHVQAARGLAEDAIREVRVLSYLMHPPMLDEAGLGPTLQWYARGFSERSDIETAVEVSRDLGRLPQQIETTVFRIVQEALTNLHRYSGSRTATIRLSREEGEVRVEIQDHGCGLQPMAPGRNSRLGVGIAGMRERVKQLNGAFEIESMAGRGTTVRAVLPIAPEHSRPEFAPSLGDDAVETTKRG